MYNASRSMANVCNNLMRTYQKDQIDILILHNIQVNPHKSYFFTINKLRVFLSKLTSDNK